MRASRWFALLLLFAVAFGQAEEAAEEPAPGDKAKKKADDEADEPPSVDKERRKKAEGKSYCEYENCYELLGVQPTSGPIPIKRAYRRLAAEYHPDKCPSGDIDMCRAEFPKYANAYEILSNAEMRKNYDYVLANPYEFPAFYFKYSRPKYAPKSDLRFVFLVTVIGASAMQYLLRKSQHEQAFAAYKKAPTTRYQERVKDLMNTLSKKAKVDPKAAESKDGGAPPSPKKKPTKQEQQEGWRKEAEALLDAELAAEVGAVAPSPYDCLAVDLFKLPITARDTMQWYLAGGAREPAYMTRKALGLSAAEWAECPEAEQTELIAKELWVADNLTAYEAEIAASEAPKSKTSKEKRAKRQAKANPGAPMILDD